MTSSGSGRRAIAVLRVLAGGAGAVLLALVAVTWALANPPKTPTTLTISADPPTVFVGDPTTVTFQVTPIPDGGYVWAGSAVGELPVDPTTGIATHVYSFPFAGTFTIEAVYLGTDTFEGTSYVDAQVTAEQHRVTATAPFPASPLGRGDPFDVDVTLDPVPDGGQVQLQWQYSGSDGWHVLGWVGVAGAETTLHVDGLDPASYAFRAVYSGTNAYSAATTDPVTIDVYDRPTTTTVTTSPNPSLWGASITVDVTVSPIPDDGGGVSIWRDGQQFAWVPMDWSTGTGSVTINPGDPGDHTLRAAFQGSGGLPRWAPSEASVTHTVSSQPLDATPPVGSMVIDHGNATNPDGYAVLTLTVDEPNPGFAEASNDGVTWIRVPGWEGDVGWSLTDPATGGSGPEGLRTVYARWTDAYGNVSDVASDTINLDYMAPIGTVVLPDGSYYYVWPDLTVDVTASDAGSGVTEVALSNDGASWTELPYAPEVQWTVPAGDGPKTIYVKWRDGDGHWSDVKTTTLILDSTKPSTSAPMATFAVGQPLSSGRAPVRFTWTGSDATGVASYALSWSVDGGAWSTPVTLKTASTTRLLAAGHVYRCRVRATDRAGNVGPWVASAALRPAAYQQTSTAVRLSGTWATSWGASYWGGSVRRSSVAGSKATFTFTGRSVAWIATLGTNRGIATVYVNGTRVATIDLRATTTLTQRVVWARTWAASATRTVVIRVSGTSGRPRVDVDGFLILR